MKTLVRRSDGKVLAQPIKIHPKPVVLDAYLLAGDRHMNLGGVRVIRIVDELTNQLDTLRVKTLADRDQMALVDSDWQRCGLHRGDYTALGLENPGTLSTGSNRCLDGKHTSDS